MSRGASKGQIWNKRFSTLELIAGLDCRANGPPYSAVDLDVHGGIRVRKSACIAGDLGANNLYLEGNASIETLDANTYIGETMIGNCGIFGTLTADHIRALTFEGDLFGNVCGNITADTIEAGTLNIMGGNLDVDKITTNCIEVSDDIDVTGNLNIQGNLNGTLNFSGDLDINKITTNCVISNTFTNETFDTNIFNADGIQVSDDIDVTGDLNIQGNLNGMLNFSGDLDVNKITTNCVISNTFINETFDTNIFNADSIQVTGNLDIQGDVNANLIKGDIIGDITGNVNGPVNGDVLGNVLGDVLGNVNGDVLGNVLGDVLGNVNGDVLGNVLGDVLGNVLGDVLGNVLGDVNGNVNGPVNGDVLGNVNGMVLGDVKGNVMGESVTGNSLEITGDVIVSGNIQGTISGNVTIDTGDLANAFAGVPLRIDPTLIDAFSRVKVSNPFTLLDEKFLTTSRDDAWDTIEDNTGVFTHFTGYNTLTVSAAGDRAVRQSRLYAPYQPGKGLNVIITGTLETNGGNANVISRIGFFDDGDDKLAEDTSGSNGYFFELDGTDLYAVERTDVTGTVVETRIPQASWNVDPFDGTGPSGITLDVSKRQIFAFELEWLGVGSAVTGFFINRRLHFAHIFFHANRDSTIPYITRPSLPVRYEIESTGGAGEMVQVCSTVISDGGYDPKGGVFADGKITGQEVSIGTGAETPLIGLRLRPGFRRTLVNVLNVSSFSQSGGNYVLRVYYLPAPVSDPFTGGTWGNVNADYSAVQVNSSPTSVDLTGAIKVDEIYVVNQIRTAFAGTENRFGVVLTSDIAGNTDVVVMTGQTFTGTVNNVSAAAQWQEFE